MKRRSYKYIFYFNVFVILSLFVAALVVTLPQNSKNEAVPVSITTPLLHTETVNVGFCKNAKAAVIIDSQSGAVLYEKNSDMRLPMASTTKIMTALAVIENSSPDDVITVSPEAAGIQGSSIYLKAGEKMTVLELLYGLLLESGNDAAAALAIGVFGSQEACVDYMNSRAHSMGLVNTSFCNVHGLDDKNHYTTAYELSLISKNAMENELFSTIVSTKSYVTSGENPRYFSNHNRLLSSFDGAVGIKTGYTSKSGRCLVSAAQFEDERYIAVTLGDPLDWNDHKEMHSYAREHYDSIEIAHKESFRIYCGNDIYAPIENIFVTISGDADFFVDYKITLKGDVGKVEFFAQDKKLGSFGIVRLVKGG